MFKNIIKRLNYKTLQLLVQKNRSFHNFKSHLILIKPCSCRTITTTKNISASIYVDQENKYAFNILNKDFENKPVFTLSNTEVNNADHFNKFLDQNWRESSGENIVKAFKSVKNFCIQNDINISDKRFDKLVDGLMDHCEKLTDDELYELLACLVELPRCESYSSHNYHDIWSCLDDICCWKMIEWDLDRNFALANVWFKLNLGRLCDFIYVFIDRQVKRAEKLSKDQLVTMLFYFNVCRKRPVDFEYEYALQKKINEMSVDEMAVVAMGYFKTKTKIKLPHIIEAMMQKVKEESKTVHEITLTAIIKVIRFSQPTKSVSLLNEMLDSLTPEIDRLSNLSAVHIVLVGTGIQVLHKNSLEKCCQKLVKDISDINKIRIKDIERILNTLTMFDCNPKTDPNIFDISFKELHKPEREIEMIKYPKCLMSALNYLSMKGIYSDKLMDKVLESSYVSEVFGKTGRDIPREILSLDCSIEIECPDYKGNRLRQDLRRKAAKWCTEWFPSKDQYKRISAAEKLILDTLDTVKSIVKEDKHILTTHVLPHFSRGDIILCKNTETDNFVEPMGFENYILGDIMYPLKKENLKWYSLIILGWNNTIRDSSLPLGQIIMKKRQLEKIGFIPVYIFWKEFLSLPEENRIKYISRKLL